MLRFGAAALHVVLTMSGWLGGSAGRLSDDIADDGVNVVGQHGLSDSRVTVDILQLDGTAAEQGSRRAALDSAIAQLQHPLPDFALIPEGWFTASVAPEMDEAGIVAHYQHLAKSAGIILGGTYLASESGGPMRSNLVLVSTNGTVLLRYEKPLGNASHPTCGSQFRSVDVPLPGSAELLRVGLLLGTDHLFMESARVLMVQGARLVLHAMSESQSRLDETLLFWEQRDNGFDLAVSNYAAHGGSSGLPGEDCFFSISQGNTPTQQELARPCLRAGPGHEFVRYNTTISRFSPRNPSGGNGGGFVINSRKPFDYQSLCYEQEAAHAKGSHNIETAETHPFVVKVALLQLSAAVNVSDPLRASYEKAAAAIRSAKQDGVDVVLLPEQWSVGYMVNANLIGDGNEYNAVDSTAYVYEGYLKWATPVDGPYVKAHQDLARELGIAIALPFVQALRDPGTGAPIPPRNSVALIDRFGTILYVYQKVHVAWSGSNGAEVEGLNSAGRGWPTAQLDIAGKGNVSVCSFICFDREHPESARACKASGAELILVPTACGLDFAVRTCFVLICCCLFAYRRRSVLLASVSHWHKDSKILLFACNCGTNLCRRST